MQKHLVIFVKAPIMGRVKTRLAKGIGRVAAWRFYKNTVTGLLNRVTRGKWKTTLYVSPDDYKGTFFPKGLEIIPQGRGDLGERMQRVFDDMPPGPVVLIGGDIPGLGRVIFQQGFNGSQGRTGAHVQSDQQKQGQHRDRCGYAVAAGGAGITTARVFWTV